MTDPRLDKIAEFHFKYVDEHGGTTGDCSECGWTWPCATYRWATADPSVIRADCTWDLDECEFDYIHPGTDTPNDGEAT